MRYAECAINVSEGRRKEVIEAIVQAARLPGVRIMDVSSDADHNRTVISLLGDLPALEEAAFAITQAALPLIDLRTHQGTHPRIGAVDVIPFCPISDVTMVECVEAAHRTGQRIAGELGIPVYFYEEAASAPHRRNLADIRAGQFEGLAAKMRRAEWHPDVGPPEPHPTAGATVVGARPFLVAYNVYLGTSDITIARSIAQALRGRDGGLANVKALGMDSKGRGLVQVSINLVNPFATPLYRVLEMVRMEAARYGVPIVESEVVGLLPLVVLVEVARYYLHLHRLTTHQILETHLLADCIGEGMSHDNLQEGPPAAP
jgi:glutamate formiminotransferase